MHKSLANHNPEVSAFENLISLETREELILEHLHRLSELSIRGIVPAKRR